MSQFLQIKGKTLQKNYDSLYCNAHFIVVVWNQTCSISKVCLYSNANKSFFFPPESGIETHSQSYFSKRGWWSTGLETDEFKRFFFFFLQGSKLFFCVQFYFAFHEFFHIPHKLELQWYQKQVKTENFSLKTFSIHVADHMNLYYKVWKMTTEMGWNSNTPEFSLQKVKSPLCFSQSTENKT